VELWFGKIEGGEKVYVNGNLIGAGGDSRAASVYDAKALLHTGENIIAVAVANWGLTAGINKGAMLRFVNNPPPVQWSRSVFNGLAQIIVQSTRESGQIKLTAHSAGLKSATVLLESSPATPRPSLP